MSFGFKFLAIGVCRDDGEVRGIISVVMSLMSIRCGDEEECKNETISSGGQSRCQWSIPKIRRYFKYPFAEAYQQYAQGCWLEKDAILRNCEPTRGLDR